MPEQYFREIDVYYSIFIRHTFIFTPSTPGCLGDALDLVLYIPTHHNNHSLLFNTCWPSDSLIPCFLTVIVYFITGSNKSSIQFTFLVAFSFVIIFPVLFIFQSYSENTE